MQNSYLIKNASIVNEGKIFIGNILIENGIISKISKEDINGNGIEEIDATGLHLIPGMIDDQVHFREPGLTHKANIYTESRAAVAGGITTFMEMPNTVPQATTIELLEDKYQIAKETSIANYSFFFGATNENIEEVMKVDPKNVCGVKVFMGSSTGNMLVDSRETLENIFKNCDLLIATHCEDEATIRKNTEKYKALMGEDIPIKYHPIIRDEEACYKSSSMAVELAKKYNTRLHILHISTAKETELFRNDIPLEEKRITAEACVHHLWFTDKDYDEKQTYIKWNPAVKTEADRDGVIQAVLDDRIDIIATDHAPHTIEEKENSYFKAPSGGPLVQHAVVAVLEMVKQGKISLEKAIEKMAHSPAICFQLENRGFIREGYAADLVLVNLNDPWTVEKSNVLAKCKWSPFEGTKFSSKIITTFVNGGIVYNKGEIKEIKVAQRLTFDR